MEVRKIEESELSELVKIYKEDNSPHNLFKASEEDIIKELEIYPHGFLVCTHDAKIIGGLAILQRENTKEHQRYRIKHLIVKEEFQTSDAPKVLLEEAEKIIGKGKIEIHVADTETPDLEFYMKNGYEIEGELNDHYRLGEKCYVLGKTLN